MAPTPVYLRRARRLLTLLAYTHTRFPPERPPALVGMLREWLDTWLGVGLIVEAMGRQGFDIQLTRYAEEGWRATFYGAGTAHSLTRDVGSAWARTPWQAVQIAALATLMKFESL